MGMSKASSPPSISIVNYEWIGENYEITGQFSDPDGDVVTISATISDGTSTPYAWGTIQTSGNQWMATGSGIPGAEANSIVLTACDNWNQCSSQTHEAGATPGGDDDDTVTPTSGESEDEEDGMALAGFVIAIIALVFVVIIAIVAMVVMRRK